MKAIQQLIEHFEAEGALSAAQIAFLIRKGYLLPRESQDVKPAVRVLEKEVFEETTDRLTAARAKERRKKQADQPRSCVRRWWKEQVERLRQARARQGK